MGDPGVRGAARTITVWDLPTRIFKWLLVVFVSAAFLLSSRRPHGLLFLVHVSCGYAVVLLLLFRLGWGFVGGEHARFRSFVRGWRPVRAYGRDLLRFAPPRTTGHNPVGGWVILLMLGTLAAIVLTGLLSEGKTGGGGILSGALPAGAVGLVGWVHGTLGFAIIWLAGAHVAGVLVESLLHRENLVRTMITGRKRVADPAAVDARGVSPWRAGVLVVAIAVFGVWMVGGTRMPPAGAVRAEGVSARR